MATVGIVGGGIAGTAAAYGLRDTGADVVLLESESHLGGRMSTRERGGCVYDYGANFVKGADERFRRVLRDAVGDDIVTVEGDIWLFEADGTLREGRDEQAPKYTTPDGVRGIAAAFARESGARVETDTRVGHVTRRVDGWTLSRAGGGEERVDCLVLALPADDAAGLLADADWGQELCTDLVAAAGRVPHRPVDSVVMHYPFRESYPFYGLVTADESRDVVFLAREECKPGHVPDGESLLVAQTSPQWTTNNPDAGPAEAGTVARAAARELLDDDRRFEPDWTDHARWAAAVPDRGIDPGLVERTSAHDLALAGDWVAGAGRTDAALQTGLEAANRIARRLGK